MQKHADRDYPGGPVAKTRNIGDPDLTHDQGTRLHTSRGRVCIPQLKNCELQPRPSAAK